MLSCATCGDVVGIDWTSGFQILKRYTKHKDAILDYIKKNPHKSTLADPEYDETWEPVRELIAEIASTPHYEPLPFEDDDTVND